MCAVIASPTPRHPAVERLGKLLHQSGSSTAGVVPLAEADVACQQAEAEVVIVHLTLEHLDGGLDAIRRARSVTAGHVLALGPATDPKLILRAMQVGADLFLDEAEPEAEYTAAQARLHKRRLSGAHESSRVIAVLPAGGGSGASTVAVNLAVVLAAERGACGLIDLNAGKGDLAPLLDIRPQYTLADLCRNESRLDAALFEKLLTRHTSGVALLAAPPAFGDVRVLTEGGVAQALALARRTFADVVIDLEDCFHAEQRHVLDHAAEVLLVCRLDFTSLRNTRRTLDHLGAAGVPRNRVKVVVNQFGRPCELPVDEAEEAVGEKLTRFVPFDPKAVNEANNAGVPAAVRTPAAPCVRAIAQLTRPDSDPRERKAAGAGLVPKLRFLFPVA